MQTSDHLVAPVLILGLGNLLLGDDGVGPTLLQQVQRLYLDVEDVDCIDGGTQGLALLGLLEGRRALIVLDAFASGKAPGAVSLLQGEECLNQGMSRSTAAHESNVGELLAAAHLLGELPERVFLIGIEPENVRTEFGLSEPVTAALPAALALACEIVERARAAILLEQPQSQV